jgi:tetratricopeptide (TPR) repeat protein
MSPQSDDTSPSPEFTRFAAEYFYDFGDLLRSAQLFSGFTDEPALGRQADALWLAGRSDIARNIWAMLAADPLQNRSLYNLAVTARTRDESARLLKRLADTAVSAGNTDAVKNAAARLFGLIRYSRLLSAPQAVEVLLGEKTPGTPAGQSLTTGGIFADSATADSAAADSAAAETLIDLEILRRRAETREPARTIAETWMLLDRKPDAGELYEWGAWYFCFQRYFAETDILLKNAARNNIDGQWRGSHEGLKRLREDDTDGAKKILVSKNEKNINWTAAANIGRIREAHRAQDRALESYRKAAELVMDRQTGDDGIRYKRQTASRIQVNIARVLKNQGKIAESREALDYAIELDPENLTARLELSRLDP